MIYSDVLYDISGSWAGPPYTNIIEENGNTAEIATVYGDIQAKISAGYRPGDTSFGLYTDLGMYSTMTALPSSFIDRIVDYKPLEYSLYNNTNVSGYVDISGGRHFLGDGDNMDIYYIGSGPTDTNLYNVKLNYLIGRGGDAGSGNGTFNGGDGGYGLSIYGKATTTMNISTFYGFQKMIIHPGADSHTEGDGVESPIVDIPSRETSLSFLDKNISTLYLSVPKAETGFSPGESTNGLAGANTEFDSVTGTLVPTLSTLGITYGNIMSADGGSDGTNLLGLNGIKYGDKAIGNTSNVAPLGGEGLIRLIITKTTSNLSNTTLSNSLNINNKAIHRFKLFKNLKLAGPSSGFYSIFTFVKSTDVSGNSSDFFTDISGYFLNPGAYNYLNSLKLYLCVNKIMQNSDGSYGLNSSLGKLYELPFTTILGSGGIESVYPIELEFPTFNYISILPFYFLISQGIEYSDGSFSGGGEPFVYVGPFIDFISNLESGLPATIIEINCLLKGTRVKILGGYKLIENIKVGDFILSHKGQLVQVLKTVSWDIKWSETATNESNTVYKIPAAILGCDEDTYISAYHQILIDGKLVAAKDAGLELARESEVGSEFTFYHLHVVDYENNHLVVNGNCIVESWSGLTPKPIVKPAELVKVNIGNLAKKVLKNTRAYLNHLTPKFLKNVKKVVPN